MVGWTRVSVLAVPGVLVAAAALAPACGPRFDGPYPCIAGFASCGPPGGAGGACQTNVTTDPQNCGGCGSACPQGATCASGACGAPPRVLASDVSSQEPIALNSSAVFYWSSSNKLTGIAKGGGPAFAVPVASSPGGSQGMTFAVDDTSAYYVGFGMQGQDEVLASPASPGDGGATPAPRVVATIPSNLGTLPQALLIAGGTLFGFAQANGNGVTVVAVPTRGGSLRQVASLAVGSSGQFAVDATRVYVAATDQSSCQIVSAPVSGGAFSTLVADTCTTSSLASDGASLYFAFPLSTYGDNGAPGSCAVLVQSVPVAGGAPATVASIPADELPLQVAVDASNVYVATNASLWRAPIAGGTPVRVAGNLGAAASPQGSGGGGCSYGGGGGGVRPVSLAVDDATVYLAVLGATSSTETLFAIPK